MAMVFLALIFLSFMGYSLFWVQPDNDEGRQWLIHWRPLLLRNVWTQTPSLSASELRLRMGRENLWVVDVRTPEEFSVSTLPGAMTVAEFESRIQREKPEQIVAFCTIGVRSGAWVDGMRAKGVMVENLEGGILGWTHLDAPLVDPGTRPHRSTLRVHVNSAYWDLVAEGYEAVW